METKIFAATIAGIVGFCSIGLLAPHPNGPGDLCGGVGIVLCHFLPVAPDLDDDIDLTKQIGPADGAVPAPDTASRADVCAAGCT